MLEGDLGREAEGWFNSLEEVPTKEIPRVNDVIADALRMVIEEHGDSIIEFRNWQVRRTQPLTQVLLSPVEDWVYQDSTKPNHLTGTINVARDAARKLIDRKN